jgi:hypothetical protein
MWLLQIPPPPPPAGVAGTGFSLWQSPLTTLAHVARCVWHEFAGVPLNVSLIWFTTSWGSQLATPSHVVSFREVLTQSEGQSLGYVLTSSYILDTWQLQQLTDVYIPSRAAILAVGARLASHTTSCQCSFFTVVHHCWRSQGVFKHEWWASPLCPRT